MILEYAPFFNSKYWEYEFHDSVGEHDVKFIVFCAVGKSGHNYRMSIGLDDDDNVMRFKLFRNNQPALSFNANNDYVFKGSLVVVGNQINMKIVDHKFNFDKMFIECDRELLSEYVISR